VTSAEIESLVAALNARFAGGERLQVIGAGAGDSPRFELYHFFMSMCSYKLRLVLDEIGAAYVSHDIDIFPPDIKNYYPEYVRVRLKGREHAAGRLVDGYTGRSSTETEGFDPCVVPTLVDHEAGVVLANSKRMCLYLAAVCDAGAELVPQDLRDEILRQVDIVDRTPHVAVLYGAHPGNDRRPAFVRANMLGVHDLKIAQARKNMALVPNDSALRAAYEHKILKETAAREFIRTENDMRAAVREFSDLIAQLERDLEATGGEWLFGDRFTLADVYWAASLFRIRWLGLGDSFSPVQDQPQFPRLARYCERLLSRPSVRRAIVDWPMHPPSENVPDLYPPARR
jgi:2,5-dichlorohydroquinone reductive dechlorinase